MQCKELILILNWIGITFIQTSSSEYVRLRDGHTPYEGRVEVFRNGTWDSICNRGWDLKDAEVVCRQLGYWRGAMFIKIGKNGKSRSKYMLSNLACTGLESAVQDCNHRNVLTGNDYSAVEEEECAAGLAAGVTCNVPGYQGCFSHLSNGLALRKVCTSDSSITVNVCAAYCRRRGFVFAGVTHGQECCCDNKDPKSFPEKRRKNWNCALPCAGDSTQACGGALHIAVYKSEIGSCGAVYSSPSGYITSPSFPSTSTYNSVCQWTIKARGTSVIHLKFEMFQLGSSDNMTLTTKMNRRLVLAGDQFQGVIPVIDPVVTSELIVELETSTKGYISQRGFVMQYKTNLGMEPKPSQRPSVYPDIIQTTPQYTDTNYPDKMHPEKLFSKDLLIAVICVFGVIMMGLVIFVFCRIYSGSKKEDVNEVISDRATILNRAKRMTSFYIDAPDDRYYNLLPHRLHSTKQVVLNDYSRRPIKSFKPPIKPKPNIKRIGGICGFNTTKTMPAETKPRYVNLPLDNNNKQNTLIIDSGPHDYQPIRYASSQRNRMHQVEYSTPHATHDHHPGDRAYNIRTLPRAQYSAKNHHNQFYQRFDDNVISDHSRYNQYDEISLKFSTMKRNMSQMSNCSRGSDRDGYLIPRDPLDHQR